MTRAFAERVRDEMIVDTKKYRYIVRTKDRVESIYRLRIDKLGTTDALNGWENVYTFDVTD